MSKQVGIAWQYDDTDAPSHRRPEAEHCSLLRTDQFGQKHEWYLVERVDDAAHQKSGEEKGPIIVYQGRRERADKKQRVDHQNGFLSSCSLEGNSRLARFN